MKRIAPILLACMLLACLTGCTSKEDREQYERGVELYDQGKYHSALKLFSDISYKDSDKYLESCKYHVALSIVSPDSIDGYTGNIVCNDNNISQFEIAVTMLQEIDGYKNSNRVLKDATDALNAYNEEHRTARLVKSIEDKFLGYVDHCEYDGTKFYIYFSESYPITADIVSRGLVEAQVAQSWAAVREMFTGAVFDVFPEATVYLVDHQGTTLGMYVYSEQTHKCSELYDIATKPY